MSGVIYALRADVVTDGGPIATATGVTVEGRHFVADLFAQVPVRRGARVRLHREQSPSHLREGEVTAENADGSERKVQFDGDGASVWWPTAWLQSIGGGT